MKHISGFVTVLLLLFMAAFCDAAGNTNVLVSAAVLSKSNCKFNSAPAALNFGNLNPAAPVDVTATTTVSIVCHGSANPATYAITGDGGLYTNRMRHATVTTEFIPYIFNAVSGTVSKNTTTVVTLSGTVLGGNYLNAYAGNYSDTVTLTLSP